MEDTDEQAASRGWAEAHVDVLGRIGFDCSNGISPDERHVRIATGRDYRDAMPFPGYGWVRRKNGLRSASR